MLSCAGLISSLPLPPSTCHQPTFLSLHCLLSCSTPLSCPRSILSGKVYRHLFESMQCMIFWMQETTTMSREKTVRLPQKRKRKISIDKHGSGSAVLKAFLPDLLQQKSPIRPPTTCHLPLNSCLSKVVTASPPLLTPPALSTKCSDRQPGEASKVLAICGNMTLVHFPT